jgi:polyisoprenyl-teichoic acid--peptidoglycan teichoic acid transferase
LSEQGPIGRGPRRPRRSQGAGRRGYGPVPKGTDPTRRNRLASDAPRAGRPIRTVAFLVAGFVLAGVLGAGAYFAPLLQQAVTSTGQRGALSSVQGVAAPPPAPGAPFTVLLLGSDDDAKFDRNHLLTQSMILVRVDPINKRATMISIPRDLWVPISGNGTRAKIDAAYSYGGVRAAIATVESNLHVHVDEYVWVGLKGLVQLIDRVGGVDVITSSPVLDDYYPADLDTSNPYGFFRVAVLPGAQHLNGASSMKYVRSRHNDLRGDLGRSARQQQVLLALKAKGNGFNLADLPGLSASFQGELTTSLTLDRLRSLVPLAQAFDSGAIQQIVLGPPYTSGAVIGGADVLLPNWSQILPLVHQSFPAT